ncbi:hypothetical protein BpHYR1_037528 [Brachionus plicatilis]|uniref:Uncharacterized protein n=1 Tax=Brachionus plicatilis TaxID=10195 RepID=A0A3M7P2S0_BRAPC|nr:hypothetical protein BpHYR1_037528 [Brachionus plicatilis]
MERKNDSWQEEHKLSDGEIKQIKNFESLVVEIYEDTSRQYKSISQRTSLQNIYYASKLSQLTKPHPKRRKKHLESSSQNPKSTSSRLKSMQISSFERLLINKFTQTEARHLGKMELKLVIISRVATQGKQIIHYEPEILKKC